MDMPEHIKARDKDFKKLDRCIYRCPGCAARRTLKQVNERIEGLREEIIPILISYDDECILEDAKQAWKQWNEAKPTGDDKVELDHIIEAYKREADQIIKLIRGIK